jgi:hypothetical protein
MNSPGEMGSEWRCKDIIDGIFLARRFEDWSVAPHCESFSTASPRTEVIDRNASIVSQKLLTLAIEGNKKSFPKSYRLHLTLHR